MTDYTALPASAGNDDDRCQSAPRGEAPAGRHVARARDRGGDGDGERAQGPHRGGIGEDRTREQVRRDDDDDAPRARRLLLLVSSLVVVVVRPSVV